MDFYICRHCGNLIVFMNKSGVEVICCGEPMQKIVPNTTEAAFEKHIPTILHKNNEVEVIVSSVEHPMTKEHYIKWIVLETKKGFQTAFLKPETLPRAKFLVADDDEVVRAYAFCNLHGLWQSK